MEAHAYENNLLSTPRRQNGKHPGLGGFCGSALIVSCRAYGSLFHPLTSQTWTWVLHVARTAKDAGNTKVLPALGPLTTPAELDEHEEGDGKRPVPSCANVPGQRFKKRR